MELKQSRLQDCGDDYDDDDVDEIDDEAGDDWRLTMLQVLLQW